jgi:predicted ribosome quality control (RQC) complex YloA/Tae2 family protein
MTEKMREIYALELSLLAKELKRFEGFYIDKFYEIGGDSFRIRMSRKGVRAELICSLKKGLWEATEVPVQDSASNFTMAMRKRTAGFLISGIEQVANDRIIMFSLSKGDAKIKMIFEMLGKGNLIIAEQDMKVSLAYRQESFRDREIRNGKPYSMPKNDFLPYGSVRLAKERILKGKGSIISDLSKAVNIGPLYLEEAIVRCDLNPRLSSSEISAEQIDKIMDEIDNIASSAGGKCTIYSKNGEHVDYSVCKIKKYEAFERKEFGSVMETIREFYSKGILQVETIPKENKELKDVLASIDKQKKLAEDAVEMIESNKMIAESIFSRMNEINVIISMLQREKRITKEELQKASGSIKIIELDLKSKMVTIEV